MSNSRNTWLLLVWSFVLVWTTMACSSTETSGSEPRSGFWLTNVDSDALFSHKGLKEVVTTCVEYGFNTIYVVTWNRGYTLYPSEVMEKQFGMSMDPKLQGRDPLKDLIRLAHAKNIKVIAWFEFGFASSYHEPDGGHIIRTKPHWAARDTAGRIVTKNGFQWMNAFDPEVQSFVQSLIEEVVTRYDVDGIQGDDRFPALPTLGGYDSLTVSWYRSEHQGQHPPQNPKDTAWVEWRAQRLNAFLEQLSTDLRTLDPELTLSFSPSIYPWSKFEYLQDWPTWVREGWVDEVVPQIYRYDFPAYKKALDAIVTEQVDPEHLPKVVPGILLKVGTYLAHDTLLHQMVTANREAGLPGEVFFFYEGIPLRKKFFSQYNH